MGVSIPHNFLVSFNCVRDDVTGIRYQMYMSILYAYTVVCYWSLDSTVILHSYSLCLPVNKSSALHITSAEPRFSDRLKVQYR